MRQFENFRKVDILKKNRNLKWEYLPKKGSKIIVTSFSKTYTIVKVFFTILDVFKIISLGYNYAAILKFEKNEPFLKKLKFKMGISSKKRKQSHCN